MPTYNFVCEKCNNEIEQKMTFEQHQNTKDTILCPSCNGKMYQSVSKLNFRLKGDCWVARDGGFNSKGVGYDMTDREMAKSKEDVARMDDYASTMSARDEGIKEL